METKITALEGYKNLTFERKEGRDYVDIKYSTDNGDDYIRICVSDIKRVLKGLDITVESPAKEEHEGHKFKADVSLDVVGQHIITFKEMQYVDLKIFEEYIWRSIEELLLNSFNLTPPQDIIRGNITIKTLDGNCVECKEFQARMLGYNLQMMRSYNSKYSCFD